MSANCDNQSACTVGGGWKRLDFPFLDCYVTFAACTRCIHHTKRCESTPSAKFRFLACLFRAPPHRLSKSRPCWKIVQGLRTCTKQRGIIHVGIQQRYCFWMGKTLLSANGFFFSFPPPWVTFFLRLLCQHTLPVMRMVKKLTKNTKNSYSDFSAKKPERELHVRLTCLPSG